jgi:hypothetical protein
VGLNIVNLIYIHILSLFSVVYVRDTQKIDFEDVQKILEIIKEKAVAENNAERFKNEEIDESWVAAQNILHEVIGKPKGNQRGSVSILMLWKKM